MKYIIPISIILLILAFFLPLLTIDKIPSAEDVSQAERVAVNFADGAGPIEIMEEPPETEVSVADEAAVAEPTPSDTPATSAPPASDLDKSTVLSVLLNNEISEIAMSDYLIGVVAAEMPVSFSAEALKTQAVAARTYIMYKKLVAPSANHAGADVCGEYSCCSAYSSDAALREKWGANYEANIGIITTAVRETDGIIMAYNGEPILAAFHSSSSGQTEASADIWGDVPYLQSVKTYENSANVPNFYTAVQLTYEEFKETVLRSYPGAALGGAETASTWITDIVRSQSGRISSLTIGGVTISGADFRKLFSLRSTNIEFEHGALGLKMTTKGYGHGVGMSQFGADYFSSQGHDYAYILQWYYPGAVLTTVDSLG